MDDFIDREDGAKIIATSQLKRVSDWRLMHKNSWFSAFKAGELRPNDTRFISSMALSFLFWLILLICLLVVIDGNTEV